MNLMPPVDEEEALLYQAEYGAAGVQARASDRGRLVEDKPPSSRRARGLVALGCVTLALAGVAVVGKTSNHKAATTAATAAAMLGKGPLQAQPRSSSQSARPNNNAQASKQALSKKQEEAVRPAGGKGLYPLGGDLQTKPSELAAALPTKTATSSTTETLTVTASNEYGDSSLFGRGYPWLEGKLVVEPYKLTHLKAGTGTDEKGDYEWIIRAPDGQTSRLFGSKISFTFIQGGAHQVDVALTSSDGVALASSSRVAHAVMVKREVRSLSPADRDKFLDAMHTLWSTGTKLGREKYGPEFTGMDSFVTVHAGQASGNVKCDHWHEGSGFLTHHLALAASFDMAVKAVDPSVTTPYWDFTIEGEKILNAGLGPKAIESTSEMFSPEWFGSTDDLSHVVTGRWAHEPATLAVKEKPHMTHNSYGIVRAPWNNGRDRELTRHMSDVCGIEPVNKPIPTCHTHWEVMELDSLPKFMLEIAGYGHGPMHVNTGGVYGACTGALAKVYEDWKQVLDTKYTMKEMRDAVYAATGEDLGYTTDFEFSMEEVMEKYIHLEYFHIYRMLWRSQVCALDGEAEALECPDYCGPDTPQAECNCVCKGIDPVTLDSSDFDWENMEPCMYSSTTTELVFKSVVPTEMRKDIVTMFCSAGVKEGEQLESASPGDPLFWMIHPILDRLFTAKRLAKAQTNQGANALEYGGYGPIPPFEDENWLDYSFYTNDDFYCNGHGMADAALPHLPLPPKLIEWGDANQDGALSNLEFFDAMDPTSEAGNLYIYDNFDWNHCDPADALKEASFATGYDGDNQAREAEIFSMSGGVTPTHWEGDSYDSIRTDQTRPGNGMSLGHYRAVKQEISRQAAAKQQGGAVFVAGKEFKALESTNEPRARAQQDEADQLYFLEFSQAEESLSAAATAVRKAEGRVADALERQEETWESE